MERPVLLKTPINLPLLSSAGDKEIFVYFFAPIGALLTINILLFVSTTRQLTCGLWKRDDVKTTTEK